MENINKKDFLVLFVYPNLHSFPGYSPAIGLLSALLKQNGFKTDLVHINEKILFSVNPEEVAELVLSKKPDLIAFTATSFDMNYINNVARIIKNRNCSAPLICGGPHATLNPEDFEKSPFDIWCRGDGGAALLSLSNNLFNKTSVFDIPGLYFKKDGKVHKNKMAKYSSINEITCPDREIFNMDKLLSLKSGWIEVNAESGCPFECAYCCNHALRNVYKEETGEIKRCQFREPKQVIEEIQSLSIKYKDKIKTIFFNDELFGFDKAWFKEFLGIYKEKIRIPFSINLRPGVMNENEIAMLKESNCVEVAIGLESGSEKIRRNILNRRISNEDIKSAFQMAKKHGLNTLALCMVGIPDESVSDITQTIDLLADTKPRLVRCAIFYPFKKTKLYEYCQKKDYLIPNGSEISPIHSCHEGTVLRLKTISSDDVLRFHRLFGWFINMKMNSVMSQDYKALIGQLSSRVKNLSVAEISKEEASLGNAGNSKGDFYRIFDKNPYYWILNSQL